VCASSEGDKRIREEGEIERGKDSEKEKTIKEGRQPRACACSFAILFDNCELKFFGFATA
jgi:hypothetical protein